MTIERFDTVPTQYAKSVMHGDTLYFAGLIAEDFEGDIAAQSNEIFAQIDALLAARGKSKSDLLSITVFIASFNEYAAFKETFAKWIDHANLPARATVRAELLDPRLKVEIQGIAAA